MDGKEELMHSHMTYKELNIWFVEIEKRDKKLIQSYFKNK